MVELPPYSSDFTPFSFSNFCASGSANDLGHISRDGTWAWVASGPILQVFSSKTKELRASWNFNTLSRNLFTVTAVEELGLSYVQFPCLVVALESASAGGLLCVLNLKRSKVIKAIHIPFKITSLAIVSSIGCATVETRYLHDHLRVFFGIAAIGTERGNVMLVDLCLDSKICSDESAPSKAIIIGNHTKNIADKRVATLSSGDHICLFLNESSFNFDVFEYEIKNKSEFPSADVIVSSIKYIRSLAMLIVGFNFGGIHFWDLKELYKKYAVPIRSSQQPIVQFGFQEPENDPRNFCYLWTVRGHYQGENYKPENVTIATLYSLSFGVKDWIPRFGFYYEHFQSCVERFEYPLCAKPYSPIHSHNVSLNCSRLITLDVVSQLEVSDKDSEDQLENDEGNNVEDLSLCVIAWENWTLYGEKPISSYLAIFDLNQWYQAQMPSELRCNPEELCSYLGIFAMKEISSEINFVSIVSTSIVPHSMCKFKSHTKAEEIFFPSSLSFKIGCLTRHGILRASFMGTQRLMLLEMDKGGSKILANPKVIHKWCQLNGLLNFETSRIRQSSMASQQDDLLNLALSSNMYSFLIKCIQEGRTNDYLQTGCSVKFLFEWVWKKVFQLKKSIDLHCLPLFNCSGLGLDENTLSMLRSFERQLQHLHALMTAFQCSAQPSTEQGMYDLQVRKEVVSFISAYLRILLWLIECKLLPEHAEGDEYGEDEVSYPVSLLTKTYHYRRLEIKKIHSSVKEKEILLIDGIVDSFGPSLLNMWEEKGGSNQYPPPSLYAAIASYLIEGIMLPQKHMLMFYVLMDMTAFLEGRQSHLVPNLMAFHTLNNTSSSVFKLTKAFWQLDHQDFESAIVGLLDPSILSSDIAPWQHVRIVKSLLFQGHEKKALKYTSFRKPVENSLEEMKLHLSILIANRLISDSYRYLQKHQMMGNFEELLGHLFEGCYQTNSFDGLLELPLNSFEYDSLYKYLASSPDPKLQELLVMFLLVSGCPLEAANLNENLCTQLMERSSKSCERAAAKNAIVAGFINILPEEQRTLSQELNQLQCTVEQSECKRQPLSTSVTCKSMIFSSTSDLLKNIIDHSFLPPEVPSHPFTPFRNWKSSIDSSPFVCSPMVSERKKRRLSTVSFPSSSSFKRLAEANDTCNDYSTPLKKQKIFDTASPKGSYSDYRKCSRALSSDLVDLLRTPPICRKASRVSISQTKAEVLPSSILKTKRSVSRPFSPYSTDSHYTKTPSVVSAESEDNESVEHGDEKTDVPPRQLRFQFASPVEDPMQFIKPSTRLKERSNDVVPSLLSFDDEVFSQGVEMLCDSEETSSTLNASSETFQSADSTIAAEADDSLYRATPATLKTQSDTHAVSIFPKLPQQNPIDKQSKKHNKELDVSARSVPNTTTRKNEEMSNVVGPSPYLSTRSRSREKSTSPSAIKTKSNTIFDEHRESSPISSHQEENIKSSGADFREDGRETENSSVDVHVLKSISPIMPQITSKITPRSTTKSTKSSKVPSSKSKTSRTAKRKPQTKKAAPDETQQRYEFHFAEPCSSANSSIIEAVSETPVMPTISFVFSPPNTRSRTRRKKMEESLNASMMSNVSTMASFRGSIDPLLEDDDNVNFNLHETSKLTSSHPSTLSDALYQRSNHSATSENFSILEESTSSKKTDINTSAQRRSARLSKTRVKKKTSKHLF